MISVPRHARYPPARGEKANHKIEGTDDDERDGYLPQRRPKADEQLSVPDLSAFEHVILRVPGGDPGRGTGGRVTVPQNSRERRRACPAG